MDTNLSATDNHHARPYGVGLAYRYVIHDAIAHFRDHFDLLEISTADYIVRERLIRGDPDKELLREALDMLPCVAHGLSLSIGSVRQPDNAYLDATREFLIENRLAVFSDHLAFHAIDDIDLGVFLSMPFEEVSIEWLKRAYYHARRAIGRPFALENVTYYFPVPHGSLDEAEFLNRLTQETDCTLLLDATNVFNNAENHGYDPIAFLDRIPLDRVSQIHLAGGHLTKDGLWEDSHSARVMEPVWPLFEEIVRRTKAEIVILERDSNFQEFEGVVDDVLRAREIFGKYRSPRPEGSDRSFAGPGDVAAQDPSAPEFAQLRTFQHALMARLTDRHFRGQFDDDPVTACARSFGSDFDPAWVQRLADCDSGAIRRVASSWDGTQRHRERTQVEYENDEWAAWAEQIESEPSPA